jgi:hypothetical protein
VDLPARAGVVASPPALPAGKVDQRLQRVGGLWVQRDHAFGVARADRDPQPRVPVAVGVEAVDGEAADLVAAGAAPPGHDQRRPLIRVGQLLDGGHQLGEFVVGDEPRQRLGDLRDVATGNSTRAGTSSQLQAAVSVTNRVISVTTVGR